MAEEIIEVEAESLSEAHEQLKHCLPDDLYWLSKEVISDGQPKTVQATADTFEAALASARQSLPPEAIIIEEVEVTTPKQQVVQVEAFNELEAVANAKWLAREQVGYKSLAKNVRLIRAGRSGLLGLGQKPNQYEVEIWQPATVEINYKMKAKILVRLEKVQAEHLSPEMEAGNLELEFEMQRRNATLSNGQLLAEEDNKTLRVILGDNYFSHSDDRYQHVFDLTHRRVTSLSLPEKVYTDNSLFPTIGFRTAEFQQRLVISDSLQKVGIKHRYGSLAQNEHLFSLQVEGWPINLVERSDGLMITLEAEKEKLFSYSLEGLRVDPLQISLFIKFWRYVLGGHPLILARIEQEGQIPRHFKLIFHDGLYTTIIKELTLKSVRPVPDILFTFGFNPGVFAVDKDECSQLIHRVWYETGRPLEKRSEAILTQAESDLAQQRYFIAWLGFVEHQLQTGWPAPSFSEAQNKHQFRDDANVKSVSTSSNPKSQEEAERAVKTLQKLRQAAGEAHEHVLMILEAQLQASLNKVEEARELLLIVLNRNPYIAAVYKDLGDLYAHRYEMTQAWRCWDLGRKLAPNHPLFENINMAETRLIQDYPSYF